jgi:hypothetical protein
MNLEGPRVAAGLDEKTDEAIIIYGTRGGGPWSLRLRRR